MCTELFLIAKIVLKNETKIQKLSDIGGLLSLEVGKTIVIRILYLVFYIQP